MDESVAVVDVPVSREPGVYRSSWGNAWFVQVRHAGKLYYCGSHRTLEAANDAARTAKSLLRGSNG